MTPEQFAKLREILLTLPHLPESGRHGYVEETCGEDEELLGEALAYLDLDRETPSILRTGALGTLAHAALGEGASQDRLPLPERVGPYELRGVLGRGGMGIVYRAEQTVPIRREVAIKLMHRGTDPALVAARFEAERQVLAAMEHPNIARVLEVGATEHDEPYFVMELVRGSPITEYCVQNHLSSDDRIELFGQACLGVQHAHQRGIIHRDLKPSNLLVMEIDGRATVKIIDFGIARAVAGSLADAGLTQEGQVLGTPQYMSPEQAAGDTARMDTRTDVYSLGVILYELLSDRLPYEVPDSSILDRARAIQENPARPLTTELKRQGLDPDLDTIVHKALQKDPGDRYDSAAALGDDLRRCRQGQPILAHPPSTIYQLKKLARRHRLGVAFLATVTVLLIGFGITMGVMFEEQRVQRHRAEAEKRTAQRINTFLQDMLSSADPYEVSIDVTVREVLEQASRQLELGLDEEPATRMELHRTLANTYSHLGENEQARQHLEAAWGIFEQLEHPEDAARALLILDRAKLAGATAQREEGRSLALEAMRIDGDPGLRFDAQLFLQSLLIEEGRCTAAESLALDTIVIGQQVFDEEDESMGMARMALADALRCQDRMEEAEAQYREVGRIFAARLGESDPRYILTLNQLAASLDNGSLERRLEAEALKRQVLEGWKQTLGEDHPGVAIAHNNLAVHLLNRNVGLEEAEQHVLEAMRIWKSKLGEEHPYIVTAYNNLGYLRQQQLDFAGATQAYHEGLKLRSSGDPDDIRYLPLMDNLVWARLCAGDPIEALEVAREEQRIQQLRYAGTPYANGALPSYCSTLAELGRADEVEALAEIYLAGIPEPHPNFGTAIVWGAMARACAQRGRADLAQARLEQALPYFLHGDWSETERIPARIYSLGYSAELLQGWGRVEEADSVRQRADELREIALAAARPVTAGQ